jgi:DNA-binding NarL/FixJ family response regulator
MDDLRVARRFGQGMTGVWPQCLAGWRDATMGTVGGTVLIVDDHAEFRASARVLLEAEGFVVVGEAVDGGEAVEVVALLHPGVVLLDVQLPGEDGIAVAERLGAAPDAPVIVLISSREAAAYGPRLTDGCARGFISKSCLSGQALAALLG